MPKALFSLALITLVSASASWLHAAPIRLDVDAFDAPASETEIGFTRMTAAGMTGDAINGNFAPAATINGVTVTASFVVGNMQFRDRGIASATVPPPPFQNLLRDFIGSDNNPAGNTEIDVRIAGLAAGQYEITTFHHDWNVASLNNLFDIVVNDANGMGQLLVNDATFNNTDPYFGETIFVTSNGVDDILLRIISDANASVDHRVRFNGIVIAAVPEPASIALWTLGSLGLAWGARRRRN
jgi:hypothetical protein